MTTSPPSLPKVKPIPKTIEECLHLSLIKIKKYFKQLAFKTTIPRNVRVAEAPSHGVPIGAYDKFSKGAKAYKEFTKEVEERTK